MSVKSKIFVSPVGQGKSVYELYCRKMQCWEIGYGELVIDGRVFNRKKFDFKKHIESRYHNANLIILQDVPKSFNYSNLYEIMQNGYTNCFGRLIIPIFFITTEHLPKREDSFDRRFEVFKIQKI